MFSELIAAMQASGLDPTNAPLVADGMLKRFRIEGDKPRTLNGWIVLHDNGDGTHGAAFGSWKNPGERFTWHSKKERVTAADRAEFARKMKEARTKQTEEQNRRHAAAAEKARRLWRSAKPAKTDHPYLTRKQVKPHGLRQINRALVIPVRDASGELTGLQFIQIDGSKKFLGGTAVAGCYFAIGKQPADALLLAEGFATAATLYEATGHPCAVAFFAGNLRPVALALRSKYPAVQMVVCADADNAGRTAAAQAAAAVNGLVIEPEFNPGECFSHG